MSEETLVENQDNKGDDNCTELELDLDSLSCYNKKIAVITGVSSGLGRSFAKELMNKNWFVFGCARRKDRIDQLNKQYYPKNGYFSVVDVTNNKALLNWANMICKKKDQIPKLLIANAGISIVNSIEHAKISDFEDIINLNVKSVFVLCKAFLPHMKCANELEKRGIIGISSGAGRVGVAKMGAYCASKWALEGLFQSMAQELKDTNVMCCTFNPGTVQTDMSKTIDDSKFIPSDEVAKSAIPQFLKFIENEDDKFNGKQLDTVLINDKRQKASLEIFMKYLMARM